VLGHKKEPAVCEVVLETAEGAIKARTLTVGRLRAPPV
jgi:hypothetical protein